MTLSTYAAVVIVALLVLIALKKRRRAGDRDRPARRHGSVGPAAAGAFYELLNEDKRNAIEVVVEDKAAYRESEHADDTTPPEPR